MISAWLETSGTLTVKADVSCLGLQEGGKSPFHWLFYSPLVNLFTQCLPVPILCQALARPWWSRDDC